PVVARECAAVPETVGDAALLLPADSGPVTIAEGLAAVLERPRLARHLVELGRVRRKAFAPERARATFLEHLASVA
ncbi:MAG: hypothetical protein ACRDV9_15350, partial [Acidimicrobiia bacterium]